jgi:hypothetical protein
MPARISRWYNECSNSLAHSLDGGGEDEKEFRSIRTRGICFLRGAAAVVARERGKVKLEAGIFDIFIKGNSSRGFGISPFN